MFSRQNKSRVLFSVFNFTSSPVHGAGSDKILFSAPAPDDESERRQHLLNIPRLRQFHIPSLLSLPGKTKTRGPRTAMIKVDGNLAPAASIKYLDKKRSHNYCHDHCDIFLHVVTNDRHTSLRVDLHTRLEVNIKRNKITTGIYSEKRQTWWASMLRMPRPQPTMSLRQQESGTECEAREKVVLAQSRYDWVPQHPSYDDTVMLSELWDEREQIKNLNEEI